MAIGFDISSLKMLQWFGSVTQLLKHVRPKSNISCVLPVIYRYYRNVSGQCIECPCCTNATPTKIACQERACLTEDNPDNCENFYRADEAVEQGNNTVSPTDTQHTSSSNGLPKWAIPVIVVIALLILVVLLFAIPFIPFIPFSWESLLSKCRKSRTGKAYTHMTFYITCIWHFILIIICIWQFIPLYMTASLLVF